MQQSDRYQLVEDAFREGRIEKADSATLSEYLNTLSNQPIQNEYVRHRDIVRGITINHILLQRHTEYLDRKNATTQKLVVALTVAALFAGAAQIFYAVKAENRAEQEEVNKSKEKASKAATAPVVEAPSPPKPASTAPAENSKSGLGSK